MYDRYAVLPAIDLKVRIASNKGAELLPKEMRPFSFSKVMSLRAVSRAMSHQGFCPADLGHTLDYAGRSILTNEFDRPHMGFVKKGPLWRRSYELYQLLRNEAGHLVLTQVIGAERTIEFGRNWTFIGVRIANR